jgi:glycosyltransferase involved in cell wall biosynthesis
MAGANEFALFTAKLLRSRIVWGIRASALDYKDYDRVSAITFRVGAALSRFVDLIIVNSHSGRNHYVEHNYRPTRTEVVPNGINTNEFCIDHQGGARFRKELGVLEGEVLIGIVGRLDPMKDHKNFLKAAALVAANLPGARFVCVGNGLEELPNALAALVPSLDPIPKIEWLGGRTDMRAVYNGLDLLVSSSAYGEGFSNAIGEGMACGVPCVSTDVGDSARIIGDTRRIVPPGDHSALARACLSTIASISTDASLDPINIRQRILDNYDEERLVDRTETLLGELVNDV